MSDRLDWIKAGRLYTVEHPPGKEGFKGPVTGMVEWGQAENKWLPIPLTQDEINELNKTTHNGWSIYLGPTAHD